MTSPPSEAGAAAGGGHPGGRDPETPSGATGGEAADRGPEVDARVACLSCQQLYPHSDLDRQLWCPTCREDLSRRVRWGRHGAALLVTIPFAIWILVEGRFGVLPLWAWLVPLGGAYYLGYRIGREIMKGFVRLRRGPGSDPD